MSNAIRAETDSGTVEVYQSKIHRIIDEYIEEQADGEEALENALCFTGLMKRINLEVFRDTSPKQYNLQTCIDTSDADGLNKLWDLYATICYRYKHRVTLQRFSVMTGISMETFNLWRRGDTRGANNAYIESVKKWVSECENSLVEGLESNSIGAIFGLKAAHGWKEAQPTPTDQYISSGAQSTPEQIRQKYANTSKPQLPLDDD